MAIVTATVGVNAAFLQEIKDDNIRLRQQLEELREVFHMPVIHGGHFLKLMGMFDQLRDQLAMHFALEEAYGYFEDPVSVAPRLARQAGLLRNQHRTLFVWVCDLSEAAEQLRDQGAEARLEMLREAFWNFDEELRRHEDAENSLILQAFDDDIGVGD